MIPSINLYDKAFFYTNEIRNIITNDVLPVKLYV